MFKRDSSVRWFFAHLIMFGEVILDQIFFGFWRKFAEISSTLCRLAYSPYTAKYSLLILQKGLSSLSVFSMHAKILLAYSETTLYI
jgi:hypothetical protein